MVVSLWLCYSIRNPAWFFATSLPHTALWHARNKFVEQRQFLQGHSCLLCTRPLHHLHDSPVGSALCHDQAVLLCTDRRSAHQECVSFNPTQSLAHCCTVTAASPNATLGARPPVVQICFLAASSRSGPGIWRGPRPVCNQSCVMASSRNVASTRWQRCAAHCTSPP